MTSGELDPSQLLDRMQVGVTHIENINETFDRLRTTLGDLNKEVDITEEARILFEDLKDVESGQILLEAIARRVHDREKAGYLAYGSLMLNEGKSKLVTAEA